VAEDEEDGAEEEQEEEQDEEEEEKGARRRCARRRRSKLDHERLSHTRAPPRSAAALMSQHQGCAGAVRQLVMAASGGALVQCSEA